MVCVVFRAVAGSQEIQLTWCFIIQLYSQQSHAFTCAHTFKQEHVLAHPRVWQILSLNGFLVCVSSSVKLATGILQLGAVSHVWKQAEPQFGHGCPDRPIRELPSRWDAQTLTQGSLLQSFFRYLSSSSLAALPRAYGMCGQLYPLPPQVAERGRRGEQNSPGQRVESVHTC